MKPKSNPFRSPALSGPAVVFACFSMLNPSAQTADQLWKGSDTDHNVSTPTNWANASPVLNFTPVVFGIDVVDGIMQLNPWAPITNITTTSGLTKAVTINGSHILTGATTVTMDAAGADLTINAAMLTAWGNLSYNVGAGRTLTLNGQLGESDGWDHAIDVNPAALVKDGAGTAVITSAAFTTKSTALAAGYYTAGTFINAGTLQLGDGTSGHDGSLPAITTVTNNAALVYNLYGTQTAGYAISGTGTLTKSGIGALTLSGANSYTGGTTVNGGTLQINNASALSSGALTLAAGTQLTLNTSDTTANAIYLSGAGTQTIVVPNGNNPTLTGGVTTDGSTGALMIDGPSLAASHNLTFSGGTMALGAKSFLVQGDALNGPSGQTTTLSNVTLTTSGDVGVGRANLVIGGTSNVSVGGVIGGWPISPSADWGYLTIQDSAVVTATNGISGNTTAWGLNLLGGTLTTKSIQASDFGNAALLYFNGTTVKANQDNAAFVTVQSGSRAYIGSGGALIDSNGYNIGIGVVLADGSSVNSSNNGTPVAGTGSLTKSGAGTLTLSGANTYTGPTTISGGTLEIGGAGTLGGGNYAGNISNGGALLYSSSANQTLSGIITGSGSITMSGSGTLTLTQALNAYPVHLFDGAITVNSGTLIAPNEYFNLNTASSITVNGGTLNMQTRPSELGNLNLNGGTVTSTGVENTSFGNIIFYTNSTVDVGGAAVSTISVNQVKLRGTNNFDVGAGSTLNLTSEVGEYGGTGSLNKTGTGTLALSGTNTYTGVTTLAGGTLNVASLSDYGVAGSLGNRAAVDDAPGIVGILFQGGTLQYTGSTAQSTNRGIRISTVGGGGTIDASGSNSGATLSFTAASSPDFFENGGNRTLTLTGSNTGANTFAMAIGDAVGTTNFVKSGAGTWVLSGANTYTGTTTIHQGTLALGSSGSIANSTTLVVGDTGSSGAVLDLTAKSGYTIASGITLKGIGTVNVGTGNTLTINGTHAPGNSPGLQSVTGNLSYGTGSIFEWDLASSATGERGTQYDGVNVTGDLGGGGAIFKVVLNSGNYAEDFWKTNQEWTGIFTASNAINMASIFSDIQWSDGSLLTTPLDSAPGHFSFTNSGTTLTWTAVPEPTSALAGLLLGVGILRRRRR